MPVEGVVSFDNRAPCPVTPSADCDHPQRCPDGGRSAGPRWAAADERGPQAGPWQMTSGVELDDGAAEHPCGQGAGALRGLDE